MLLSPHAIEELAGRYSCWKWGTENKPVIHRLDSATLHALDDWPERVERDQTNPLIRDACLLAIQASLSTPAAEHARPTRLAQDALVSFDTHRTWPTVFPALVSLTGRSREHCGMRGSPATAHDAARVMASAACAPWNGCW